METNLEKVYTDLINQDISILDLYIYDRIIHEDEIINRPDANLIDTVNEIREHYINDGNGRSLEYHINNIIYGIEDDIDWD